MARRDVVDIQARLRSLSELAFPWVAVAVPGFAALNRLAVDSVWRDDLPTIRGLGLVALGGSTTLTTVAMQAASFVPLGPLPFRLAILSALALSVCAWLVFLLARRLLETNVPGSFLNTPLAAIAALSATLGPGLQGEGTVAGGATIPLAAGLLALLVYTHTEWPQPRRHLLTAIALGALLSENLVAAAVVGAAITVALLVQRDWPKTKRGLIPLGACAVVAAVLLLPALLRPFSPHATLNFGRSLFSFELASIDTLAQPTDGLTAWRVEVGTITLVAAVLGVVMGMVRSRTRWLAAPLIILVAADALFPATFGAVLTTDMLTPMRAFAIVAVAVAAGIGVQTLVTTLSDTGLPMAKAAAALVILFDITLVAVTSERAAFSVDRTSMHGATAYVDESLIKLQPNAMVLARSHALVWRLLAARVVGGCRPDVVIVPFPLIGHGTVATSVLAAEPGANMLIRDMALEGSPGEHAVSRIADRRPLYVELDPGWNASIAMHLRADGLWLLLEPQPLGRTDRRLAAEDAGKVVERVSKVASSTQPVDVATEAVLLNMARQQTVAAAMAQDRQATHDLLTRMAAVAPDDLFVRTMQQRLEHATGSNIDVTGLVR